VQERYEDVLSSTDLTGSMVSEINARRTAAESNAQLLSFTQLEARSLSAKATGGTDPSQAQQQADRVISRVNDTLEGTAENLADAAELALGGVRDLRSEVASLQRANDDLRQTLQQQQQQASAREQQLQQEIEQSQERMRQAVADAGSARENVQELAESFEGEMVSFAGDAAEQIRQLEAQLNEVRGQNRSLTRQRDSALNRLRSQVTGEQMVTQPDGEVIRSPSNNRLTIDLGRRNSIARGMTFEVYDAIRGIPMVRGDVENPEMPQGKASIEITEVRETSSEARIVVSQPGATIREGDIIANLAYDRNTPVRFRIYGEFDLENDGGASSNDGERLKTLVREFGGEVVDEVTVDTDIVVLGQRPEVPQDIDIQDPVAVDRLQRAQARLREYESVINEANRLNKNILNQNQLLYYIGFYDRARR
jgi:hypothetical protein